MTYIHWEVRDRIGYITLNRPEKRNALNQEVVSELKKAFELANQDVNCKVVILQSSSEAFCAGADLQYLQSLQTNTRDENVADSKHLMELFHTIYTFPKLVISKVNGPAIAGGCGLATVADFCFASNSASFGYTEVRIGFVPAIVMVFLLRKIGEGKAKEILLTGEVFSADRAKTLGLINTVVPTEELDAFTEDFARNVIRKSSGQSIAVIKKMVGDIPEMTLTDALTYAAESNAKMREKADCQKGIKAFLNKEKVSWD